MDGSALAFLLAALTFGMGIVFWIVATDRRRFLARFDLDQWRESYYLRALPNFLQALHNHNFTKPWPNRLNAVSAACFRFRARPLLKKRSKALRQAFLNQHITLFGLMETLRPYLADYILSKQQSLASECVLKMEDTIDRDRLIAFLEAAREQRAAFYGSLTAADRATLATLVDRRIIETLQSIHAIFQEHGYSLLEEFTQLRHWREMNGSELVQELPLLPAACARAGKRRERRKVA